MGQRTQIVLKIKDCYGRVVNKVYHEQWGYMCTMPILAVNFITDFVKGKNSQYTDGFRKPNIAKLSELNALSKSDKETTIAEMESTSIHNVSLNSLCDITDEYEDEYLVNGTIVRKDEETGKFTKWDDENYERVDVNLTKEEQKSAIRLLEYDYDINSGNDLRLFTGDNNDGLMEIVVEEKLDFEKGYRNYNYEISIGFVLSEYDCGTEDENENHVPNKEEENQIIGVDEYTERYKYDRVEQYVDNVRVMFKAACETFGVNQINTKQAVQV